MPIKDTYSGTFCPICRERRACEREDYLAGKAYCRKCGTFLLSTGIGHEDEPAPVIRMAWEAAMMLPPDDAQWELAEAWSRDDEGTIRAVVGSVPLDARGVQ